MMRSVLELLQGKTSITASVDLAQGGVGGDARGGLSSVMSLLQSLGLGGATTRAALGGRCRLEPPANDTCEAPLVYNWGEAVNQHVERARSHNVATLGAQESELSADTTIPGLGKVRLMLMPAHHNADTQRLLRQFESVSGNTERTGARVGQYWGVGTFKKEMVLTRDEMLDVEHDIMAAARAARFM